MTDLRPRDRALLELARSVHEPTDADRKRLRKVLAAKLAASAGLAGAAAYGSGEAGGADTIAPKAVDAANAAAATSPSNVAGSAGGSLFTAVGAATSATALPAVLVTKIVAGMFLAAGLGAGATALYQGMSVRSPIDVDATSRLQWVAEGEHRASAPQRQDFPVTHAEAPAPFDGSPQPSHGKLTTGAGARPTGGLRQRASAVRKPGRALRITQKGAARPTVPVTPNAGGTPAPMDADNASTRGASALPVAAALESEIDLLRAGISARRRGDPYRAIETFEEHRRRYPNGTLADEREVERIITLSILGRHNEARLAARAFVSSKPRSPLAARLREALGTESKR